MKSRQEKIDEYNELIDIAHQNWLNSRGNSAFMSEMERLQRELTKLYNSDYGLKSNDEFVDKGGDKKKSSSSSKPKENIIMKTEVIEEKPNIDLSKYPKDILINSHSQIMNKGLPPNKMYVAKNISSATKDKIIEFIKKQKYSMNEFKKIADELYDNKKADNKKGLIKRKQTAKEIEEMEKENRNKKAIDMFIEDKQKELDERMKVKPIKTVKPKKTYNEMNIMKGRSDLKKSNNGKMAVETQMNISKKVDKKIIKALKKSILDEFDKKIEGLGLKLSKVKPSNESQDVEIVNSPSTNRRGLTNISDNVLDRLLHLKHKTKNMPNVDINPLIRNNYK